MVQIVYINANGTRTVLDANVGQSVMEVAVKNGVPGIIGECGGFASCGTCRAHVEEPWRGKIPKPETLETEMLSVCDEQDPHTRLCCQVKVTEALEGLTVRIPAKY
jgi:2Fe-2S ferredoxin